MGLISMSNDRHVATMNINNVLSIEKDKIVFIHMIVVWALSPGFLKYIAFVIL